jgi:Zn-dependent peptidase ImmA (M78 family)/transcriptional regulator with XRE-family HTH domain
MSKGIPSFQGERLTQARKARGLTGVSLSEIAGAKATTISNYEHGTTKPPSEMVEKLACALNVPNTFFHRPMPEFAAPRFFYRSLHSATKHSRNRAESRFQWLTEMAFYFDGFFDFPAVNLPALTVPNSFYDITDDLIESLATECRSFWNVGDGPVPNMVRLLERNGFIISRISLDTTTLDAFSEYDSTSRPLIILGADKGSCARSRFDAAHELGHRILHKHVDRRSVGNIKEHGLLEHQAHRFASAFLLPSKEFLREVVAPSLDSFAALKERWRVAVAAMIMRSSDLGLLPDNQAERLWMNLARRGWKRKEPLDDSLPPEQPKLLRQCIDMMLESRFRSRSQIVEDLCLPQADIEELAGLPEGYLGEGFGDIIMLPQFKSHPSSTPTQRSDPDKEIPFKLC